MTVAQIYSQIRRRLKDTTSPYTFSDSTIYHGMEDGVNDLELLTGAGYEATATDTDCAITPTPTTDFGVLLSMKIVLMLREDDFYDDLVDGLGTRVRSGLSNVDDSTNANQIRQQIQRLQNAFQLRLIAFCTEGGTVQIGETE